MPHAPAYALSALLIVAGTVTYVLGGELPPEEEISSTTVEVLSAQAEPPKVVTIDSGPVLPFLPPEEEQELLVDVVARIAATTTTTVPTHKKAPPPPPPNKPPTTTTTTAPPSPPTTTTAGFRADYEKDFYNRINSFRSSKGLAAMTRNGSLNSYARDCAKYLASSGKLGHKCGLASLVPPWQAAGENQGTGGSVDAIWAALVSSGSHVSTMLDNYTNVGIGVYQDGNGTLWTVHVFTR
ncbi:MAG: CAP domain-containing protein [Acidimicrobiia bacterium]